MGQVRFTTDFATARGGIPSVVVAWVYQFIGFLIVVVASEVPCVVKTSRYHILVGITDGSKVNLLVTVDTITLANFVNLGGIRAVGLNALLRHLPRVFVGLRNEHRSVETNGRPIDEISVQIDSKPDVMTLLSTGDTRFTNITCAKTRTGGRFSVTTRVRGFTTDPFGIHIGVGSTDVVVTHAGDAFIALNIPCCTVRRDVVESQSGVMLHHDAIAELFLVLRLVFRKDRDTLKGNVAVTRIVAN
jgi:hypothetical protein